MPWGPRAHDDGEVQLAAVILLFGTLAVDHEVTPEETAALQQCVATPASPFDPKKASGLIARAAAAVAKDPGIMAAATLLKHRNASSRSATTS